MEQYLQNKKGLVQNVFDKVFDQYDIMNDIMSLGIHRLWKKDLIYLMNPSYNQNLIDVACGTGDIAKLFLNNTNKDAKITGVDPNRGMVSKGKDKLKKFKNLKWIVSSAENLPVNDNDFDFYTISFGLRNTKDIKKCFNVPQTLKKQCLNVPEPVPGGSTSRRRARPPPPKRQAGALKDSLCFSFWGVKSMML